MKRNDSKNFRQRVETAIADKWPRDAVLFLIGQLDWAALRGDVTVTEADELERLLDPEGRYHETIEFVLTGGAPPVATG